MPPVDAVPGRSGASRRPVLVLAPARSCSSVVVAMLGQHPSLYAFPELRLFRVQTVGQLLLDPPPGRGMPAQERTAGLVRALAQLHDGVQTATTAAAARHWLTQRRAWPVAAVLDHLLGLVDPLIGVEKSPETSLSGAALERAAQAFPRARYLHLVRHPWPTVASMVAAWSPMPYWRAGESRRASAEDYCARVWLEQHDRILRFSEGLEPGAYLCLRAEQVVNDPGSVLPAVCRWLGIAAGPDVVAAMAQPERSVYARPGPEQAWGGYDPGFLTDPRRRPVASPGSLAVPAGWVLDRDVQRDVVALAARLGYPGATGAAVAGSRYAGALGRLRQANRTRRSYA